MVNEIKTGGQGRLVYIARQDYGMRGPRRREESTVLAPWEATHGVLS